MELSKKDTDVIKGLAALLLVFLHLFNTREYEGKIQTLLLIKGIPVEYYISLIANACVAMYLFCSGYGLTMVSKNKKLCLKDNINRIIKLMINYWIVLIIFLTIGYLLGYDNYPGSIKEFLMNFFLLSKSYNGAWWFLQTYVILVLFSKNIINFVKKRNSIKIFLVSGIFYFIAFLQDTKGIVYIGNNEFLQVLSGVVFNFLLCQFSFIAGVIFVKEKIVSNIRLKQKENIYTQLISYILIVLIIAINVVIENWIIGPITAFLIIITISVIRLNRNIDSFLCYISKHSTNIWLTHMFFYMIFFEKVVYYPRYSILIFAWLIVLCIGASYIINFIHYNIIKIFDLKKRQVIKYKCYK